MALNPSNSHTVTFLRTSIGTTWLALIAATLIAWWVGTDHGLSDPTAAASLVLGVAVVKIYLIGMEFMELRHADPRLRTAFAAYCALVGVGLIGMLVIL
ncbi:cytochrome C oxidase subunit IV family protein [Sporichthya polymorpha]|uniref:cytochrome C oxidase subunit IV family protein n=1 Tax=Sporichthya polymorpha TaxID=35751 RepID=UPI000687E5E5|nr:cytochrome C oxidase subunit IV family protein [Sporichthya polymorpha]